MAVDRIATITRGLPANARGSGVRPGLPAAGETLRLAYAETHGDDLLVATGDGRTLRLTGLAVLGQELAEGDVLLARVLSNAPTLELELLGGVTPQSAPAGFSHVAAEQASMRLDQAALRQISWAPPDAAALASSWRALVHGQWRGESLQASAALPGAYQPRLPGPMRDADPAAGPGAAAERWTFPVYAWGGLQMMLRLVAADPDDERAPRRQPRKLALRLELKLPGLGRVALQVQWVAGGIQLSLAAEEAAALEVLRDLLPEMAAALARGGLRLLRASLDLGLSRLDAVAVPEAWLPQGPAAAVPPGLFRAAAEVAVLLAGSSQATISRASR